MQVFSFDSYPDRGLESLERFLRDCRVIARKRGLFQVASISLRVRHIDPLAVLESIFEPVEWHFYMEKDSEGWALAGADEVVSCRLEGPERFVQAKTFIDRILENTVAIGDLDVPYGGPHFFCGFTFFDRPGEGAPFPGGALFLPRWQVARSKEGCCAVANVKITAESPVDRIAETVWRAHRKFSAFAYPRPETQPGSGSHAERSATVLPAEVDSGKGSFRASVRRALTDIAEGKYRKIVLARALDLRLDRAVNPLHALNDLRTRYPSCYGYSLANGRGQSFIGASPERLLLVNDGVLYTEALAGSAERGKSAAEDAYLGDDLLKSSKDHREHEIVLESIVRRLRTLGLDPEHPPEPRLLRLTNVQHLHTPVTAVLGDAPHVPELLSLLHPTPAVGGAPREAVVDVIPELEPFERGLYGGPIGWINSRGEGEFTVAIRSAMIDGENARIFAGAGIVEGSDPDREWNETELKFRTLLEALT